MTKQTKSVKIGDFCRDLIREGTHTNPEIVALAEKEYPNSAVSGKHVSWYVWKMKKSGELAPDFKLPGKVKKAEAPAKTSPKKAAPKKKAAPVTPAAKKKAAIKKKAAPRKVAPKKKAAA